MIYTLIQKKKDSWIQSGDCTVKPLIDYMRQRGNLWEDQLEAIEIYLFLKIASENKPLMQLFAEGFFFDPINLNEIALSAKARETLENNTAARSLYQFSRLQSNGSMLLPKLERQRELKKLEAKRDEAWHNYDVAWREIDKQKDELLDAISQRLE